MPFTIPVQQTSTQTVEVEPQLQLLAIVRGEQGPDGAVLSPTRITYGFAATGDDGRYRTDLEKILPVTMTDLPDAVNADLHAYAADARLAMIDAVIPHVEPYISRGWAGMSVRDAGPLIAGTYQALVAAEAPGG